MPPAIGYCAGGGKVDPTLILLIATYCQWQMAHSYAIWTVHKTDYCAAGLPVLPLEKTPARITSHILFFLLFGSFLGSQAGLGVFYFSMLIIGTSYWLIAAGAKYRFASSVVTGLALPPRNVHTTVTHHCFLKKLARLPLRLSIGDSQIKLFI
ncbi:hypothetical protein [Pseudomonas vanderleydeniana]|uniref:Heme o synthase n=1 Tax=Pseudomonas vanderleydeniana TaxID=2745495 RepID=A0A9E6PH66_9PSED|nr:hypothetical protein [Pseudomonas vanderleydeniana]QXI26330.1 hypothetical protein HU752_020550 [Pseudomonas vanderleydeniana]